MDPRVPPRHHRVLGLKAALDGVFSHPASFGLFATLMTIAGAGTTLLAPMLLSPAEFGAFALISTLFQVIAASDLGMSQLADRRLARTDQPARDPHRQSASPVGLHDDLLALRYVLALVVIGVGAPLASLALGHDSHVPVVATAAAVIAGAAFMANNGMVSLYRTLAEPHAFIKTALLMQFGMTLPRLGGLMLGGVNGCFAMLALWYLALSVVVLRPVRIPLRLLSAPLKAGLPLFAFNGLWLVYLAAGRWISWQISANQTAFGLLAFGASIVLIGTGLIANISQIRYPTILSEASRSHDTAARMLARDLLILSLVVCVLIAGAMLYAGALIDLLFPRYHEALVASLILSLSGLPLALVGWTLPLTISLSRHVIRDAVALFAPVLVTLYPMMLHGEHAGGIEGQAWALVLNALVLASLQLLMLCKTGLMSRITSMNSMALLMLVLVAFAINVHHARAEPAKPYHLPDASQLTFEDNFQTLSLWNGKDGHWLPHFPDGRRTIVTNKEREFYVSPRDGDPLNRFNPFSLGDGLTITARPLPIEIKPAAMGLDYASGMLISAPDFQQTYGYFEIRARVPKGRGLWPAFWLVPADQSWPPEIDVFEVHGHRLEGYWATVHEKLDPNRFAHRWQDKLSQSTQFRIHTPDLSLDFHDYGVEWGPDHIIWTFDHQQVARIPTPPEFHKPMVMIVNLAVGGTWPGAPDQATAFPSMLEVQHIRVYQLKPEEGGSP